MLSKIIFSGIYGIGGIVDKLFAERREITPPRLLCWSTGGPPLPCIDERRCSAKEKADSRRGSVSWDWRTMCVNFTAATLLTN